MKKLLLLAMVLGFLIVGCAPNTVWLKHGKEVTDEEYYADKDACRAKVFGSKRYFPNYEMAVDQCMLGKGYDSWGEKTK